MYFELKHLKNTRFEIVELLISLVFALICLFSFWFFPWSLKGDLVEGFLRLFFFLVIFPVAYTRIILKKNWNSLFLGKHHFELKSSIFLFISLIIGILSYLIIFKSSLNNYYSTEILLLNYLKSKDGFKLFLFNESIFSLGILIFIFFSFGFINLITENFPKLNLFLVIFIFFLLVLDPFNSINFNDFLITSLFILPTLFFRRIVNYSQSIWAICFLIVILNIISNAVIIKLSI